MDNYNVIYFKQEARDGQAEVFKRSYCRIEGQHTCQYLCSTFLNRCA